MACRIHLLLLLLAGACGSRSAGTNVGSDGSMPGSGGSDDGASDGGASDSLSTMPDSTSTAGDAAAGTWCGPALCDATEVCCESDNGARNCVAIGTCTGAPFACEGPADCDDGHCCGHAGTTICMLETDCHGDFGLVQGCYTDADCAVLEPHQPKCCPIPNNWGKICRAQCGGN
jgi:hypothetical protein